MHEFLVSSHSLGTANSTICRRAPRPWIEAIRKNRIVEIVIRSHEGISIALVILQARRAIAAVLETDLSMAKEITLWIVAILKPIQRGLIMMTGRMATPREDTGTGTRGPPEGTTRKDGTTDQAMIVIEVTVLAPEATETESKLVGMLLVVC